MLKAWMPALILLAGAAGCATTSTDAAPTGGRGGGLATTFVTVTNGEWRKAEDKARDQYRHPVETLKFFGVGPNQTVVEIAPGGGWWTDILAPYARMTNGQYFYTTTDPAKMNDAQKAAFAETKQRFSQGDVYGKIGYTVFAKDNPSACEPGTADVVLTFRNVHNWIAAGWAEQAFKQMAACLKPGGTLGVEEHRLPEKMAMDAKASTGYVHISAVRKLAAQAGLVYVGGSDVNANAKDTHDHPFGVWTLPPTRRGPPAGAAAPEGYDPAKYEAIGESDRMTLKFKKPG